MVVCGTDINHGQNIICSLLLPIVVITVIEYSRAPEKFHGLSEIVWFQKWINQNFLGYLECLRHHSLSEWPHRWPGPGRCGSRQQPPPTSWPSVGCCIWKYFRLSDFISMMVHRYHSRYQQHSRRTFCYLMIWVSTRIRILPFSNIPQPHHSFFSLANYWRNNLMLRLLDILKHKCTCNSKTSGFVSVSISDGDNCHTQSAWQLFWTKY